MVVPGNDSGCLCRMKVPNERQNKNRLSFSCARYVCIHDAYRNSVRITNPHVPGMIQSFKRCKSCQPVLKIGVTVKKTINAAGDNTETDVQAKKTGPQGIGMAVAFDWGLTVQLLSTPFLSLLPGISNP